MTGTLSGSQGASQSRCLPDSGAEWRGPRRVGLRVSQAACDGGFSPGTTLSARGLAAGKQPHPKAFV